MQKLSLTSDPEGNSGIVTVAVETIDFIQYVKSSDGVYMHTPEQEYYTPGTFKYWLNVLQKSGYDFEGVDRNIAVNLRNVKLLDKTFKLAYFDNNPNGDSKSCTISWSNFNKLLEKVRKINPSVIITSQKGYPFGG